MSTKKNEKKNIFNYNCNVNDFLKKQHNSSIIQYKIIACKTLKIYIYQKTELWYKNSYNINELQQKCKIINEKN